MDEADNLFHLFWKSKSWWSDEKNQNIVGLGNVKK